jgi:predicted glycogen debranching enzyme
MNRVVFRGLHTPTVAFSQEKLQFNQAISTEWLLTNGLGGYASSTVLGLNTRKYHALLVAALRPPGERTVILSKLDEDVIVYGETYQLGANDFKHEIYPQGYRFLKEVSITPFPVYTYETGPVNVKKTIFLPYQKNSTIAFYEVNNGAQDDLIFRVYPLVSFRYYHYVINRKTKPVRLNQIEKKGRFELSFDDPVTKIISKAVGGKFVSNPIWITDLFYREEENRGETSRDESYQPGYFEFLVPKGSGKKFAIATVASDTHQLAEQTLEEFGSEPSDIEKVLISELRRHDSYSADFYASHKQVQQNNDLSWLLQAANDFIVKGTNNQRFVIAGYHWFGSWGRDTFISLPD